MKKVSEIYEMWPNIKAMADDLGGGMKSGPLINLRNKGILPDKSFDERIVARAIFIGKFLMQRHLDEIRKAKIFNNKAERKRHIGDFYEAAGGTANLAHKIGSSTNALRVSKARAYLPAARKYDLKLIADQINFDLKDVIFDRFE